MEKNENEDLTLLALNSIKRLLFYNEIVPVRLSSRELAKQLNMSPTPVTQALKLLNYQGILGHVPNKGYFVETNSPEMIRDIFNLRIALETAGLSALPDRMTQANRDALEQAVRDHMAALDLDAPKRVLMADMAFHLKLSRISGGEAGERLMQNLFEMLYLKSRDVVLYVSPRRDFGSHHREILDALGQGDVALAQKILSGHLASVRDVILQGMASHRANMGLDWDPPVSGRNSGRKSAGGFKD